MEFWSKGLGRRSMVIDIGTEKVENDESELVLTGAVKAPVNWSYVIGMRKTCWDDFFSIALSPRMANYMATPKRLGLFLKLTFFVGIFLVKYAVTLVMNAMTGRRSTPVVAADANESSGLFMTLVAAGRKSSGGIDEEPEDEESV